MQIFTETLEQLQTDLSEILEQISKPCFVYCAYWGHCLQKGIYQLKHLQENSGSNQLSEINELLVNYEQTHSSFFDN